MTDKPGKSPTILVVEDDPAILNGLMDVLIFNGYKAEGVSDGLDGFTKAVTNNYDLVLLDVMLPSMDGFTICRDLRQKKPVQPIVMLTAKGSEEDIINGFKTGADDYISKPFSIRELMVRIEAVLRRSGKTVMNETLIFCNLTFSSRTLTVSSGNITRDITRKEMDIISYLNKYNDRIVSKKELLTEVWHYKDADIETRTVDIHIQKLRNKLAAVFGGVNMIKTIRGEGYRLNKS